MPVNTPSPLPQRRLTDPRDTFDFTTPNLQTVARPVDIGNRQSGASSLTQLVDALSSVNKGLAAYQSVRDAFNEEDYQKGQTARASGGARPSDAGWAFLRGWEEMDGKISANQEYQVEVADYLAKNAETATPEEFANGLHALSNKYLQGTSDNYVRGFVGEALNIEESAKLSYQQVQSKVFQQNLEEKANIRFSQIIDNRLNDSFKGIGLGSYQELLEKPDAYAAMDIGTFKAGFGTALRDALTQAQEEFKAFGMSTAQVSDIFLDRVGQIAIEYGLPELLDYATIKDKSGVSVEDTTLGQKVKQYRQQAENQRSNIVAALDKKAKADYDKWKNATVNNLHLSIARLATSNDPATAAADAGKLIAQITSDPDLMALDYGTMSGILSDLQKIATGGMNFPSHGDEQVFGRLLYNAASDSLKMADIEAARKANQLTLSQYSTLMEKYQAQQRFLKAEGEKEPPWPSKGMIDKVMASAIDMVSHKEVDVLGLKDSLDPATYAMLQAIGSIGGVAKDYEIELQATILFTDYLNEWRTKNNGAYPTFAQWKKDIFEPVMDTLQKDLEKSNAQDKANAEAEAKNAAKQDKRAIPVDEYGLSEEGRVVANKTRESEVVKLQSSGNPASIWSPGGIPLGPVPGSSPTPTTSSRPQFDYSYDLTFSTINTGFSQGYKKADLEEMLKERKQPPEAIKNYFEDYLVRKADSILKLPEYRKDKTAGAKEVRSKFTSWGFSEQEINKALEEVLD